MGDVDMQWAELLDEADARIETLEAALCEAKGVLACLAEPSEGESARLKSIAALARIAEIEEPSK